MSEPVHVSNVRIVTSQSMATTITSASANIDEVVSYCVQAKFTGSPVGTIELQGSNNPALLGYTVIDLSISAVNGAGSYMVNVEFPAYSYVQLVYIPTSGTGTMDAVINTKRR